MRFTYSAWDGAQTSNVPDPDEVMAALAEHLLDGAAPGEAVRRTLAWGSGDSAMNASPGLQHLLQAVHARRHEVLARYDPQALLDRPSSPHSPAPRTAEEGAGGDGSGANESSSRSREQVAGTSAAEVLAAAVQRALLGNEMRPAPDMYEQLAGETHDLLRTVYELLAAHVAGLPGDLDKLRSRHPSAFPGVNDTDALARELAARMSAAESLLASLPSEQRAATEDALQALADSAGVSEELLHLSDLVETITPLRRHAHPFHGDQSGTPDSVLAAMRELHDLELLEEQLQSALDRGAPREVDPELSQRLLGAGEAVQRLQRVTEALAGAGYVAGEGDDTVLTARGLRQIGRQALLDIFRGFGGQTLGEHERERAGAGVLSLDENKSYEFGDHFLLDLPATLLNAVQRGEGPPVQLAPRDFAVFRTAEQTLSAVVVLLDLSRSMPMRGCLVAAKRMALALYTLMETQYPRDHLYLLAFADYAREIAPRAIPELSWSGKVCGTNLHHALATARRLLGRHRLADRQIILITDGEPTAHLEDGEVFFAYPPAPRTQQETLREAQRCTREGIVINTFMLETSPHLTDFVQQMTRINRGRAFFATPDRLGQYVLHDYLAGKRAGAAR